MPAAISCDSAGGVSSSPSPTRTSVGQSMAASVGRESARAHDRLLLAQKGLGAGLLGHGAHEAFQGRIAVTRAMHQQWKLAVGHLGEAAGPGEFDAVPAAFGLFRRLGARTGIEQRQLRDPLRRLPHDLEGDVAAHRQAGERKTRRRGGQNAARDRRDRGRRGCDRRP